MSNSRLLTSGACGGGIQAAARDTTSTDAADAEDAADAWECIPKPGERTQPRRRTPKPGRVPLLAWKFGEILMGIVVLPGSHI